MTTDDIRFVLWPLGLNFHLVIKYKIRPATNEDDLGIRDVQVQTWKSTYSGMIANDVLAEITVDRPPRRTKTPDPALTDSRRAFVAEDSQGKIIGFAVGGLARSKDWGYQSECWAIYVLKEYQGHGVGKKLLQQLAHELSKKYENMIVWSLEANGSSHKFYESLAPGACHCKSLLCGIISQ
jgi:GNAT superfamily N-acetyltransferase